MFFSQVEVVSCIYITNSTTNDHSKKRLLSVYKLRWTNLNINVRYLKNLNFNITPKISHDLQFADLFFNLKSRIYISAFSRLTNSTNCVCIPSVHTCAGGSKVIINWIIKSIIIFTHEEIWFISTIRASLPKHVPMYIKGKGYPKYWKFISLDLFFRIPQSLNIMNKWGDSYR